MSWTSQESLTLLRIITALQRPALQVLGLTRTLRHGGHCLKTSAVYVAPRAARLTRGA